ncbi:MAG: lytic transglycosylase domain-containing protein [Leptospiraceae bacterium]|nr:lytic transglycosylase domain-containing protein [Leptospiraceae bacterium]
MSLNSIETRMQEILTRFLGGNMPGKGGSMERGVPTASNSSVGEAAMGLTGNSSGNLPANPTETFSGQLEEMIAKVGRDEQVSPDLIRAVIRAESGGRTDAISSRGAFGLMQLMPETADELGVDPEDPLQNLQGGVRYLKDMAGQFGDLDLTLAAYNAGPGAVRRHGGVPPYQETRDYINRIRGFLLDRDA